VTENGPVGLLVGPGVLYPQLSLGPSLYGPLSGLKKLPLSLFSVRRGCYLVAQCCPRFPPPLFTPGERILGREDVFGILVRLLPPP